MTQAEHCPKCGSTQVTGGLNKTMSIVVGILVAFGVVTIFGIIILGPIAFSLWYVWRKGECHACGHKFSVTKKTNEIGLEMSEHGKSNRKQDA